LFQAVSLFDRLEFELKSEKGVEIELVGDVDLSVDESNLVAKAYHVVDRAFGFNRGLHVRLEKNIPLAAGLAGGSADGAATILACNLMFDLGLDRDGMVELGLEIGSDLPFFFSHGQALVGGRGEAVRDTDFPTDYQIVLVHPDLEISTRDSYQSLNMDLTNDRESFTLSGCHDIRGLIASLKLCGNDFERAHFESYPTLARIRDVLTDRGALLVRMSGSGPTVFGIFEADSQIGLDLEDNWGLGHQTTVKPLTWTMPIQC